MKAPLITTLSLQLQLQRHCFFLLLIVHHIFQTKSMKIKEQLHQNGDLVKLTKSVRNKIPRTIFSIVVRKDVHQRYKRMRMSIFLLKRIKILIESLSMKILSNHSLKLKISLPRYDHCFVLLSIHSCLVFSNASFR